MPPLCSDLPGPHPELPLPARNVTLVLVGALRKFKIRLSDLLVFESFCSGLGVGASRRECLDLLGELKCSPNLDQYCTVIAVGVVT